MSQGSLSDSVLMAYPRAQGQVSSSSEPEALDLYPSSSDSGAEGSRDWLPRDDPRRVRTATREPKSAVGRAPRKGSSATGHLEPVGYAPDQFIAAPNPVSTTAATRESLSVVGCAPRMDSISAGPYNPVGNAPGTFSAATALLGNPRATIAATRESRSVVGRAPRMDSPLAGTHNPVGCAPGSNYEAQAYGVGSPRDMAVPRQEPNARASSHPQPAAGETWQAGDNAHPQPLLPRAVGNAPQGILAVDNMLPAPVPTWQRADRDLAQPASRAREDFPRDFAGARAYEPPAGGRALPGAPAVAVPGPTGETAVPGLDHPGLFSSRAAGRKRRGEPVGDTRAPKHRLTSLATVSQPPGVPGPALGNESRDPNPVALLRQAAAMMGFSLQGPPQDPTDCGRRPSVGVEPARAIPAALGAPPGEESYPVTMDTASVLTVDPEMESVMSDSVLSLADSEGAERGGLWGSEAQALLRRYLPQYYAPEPSQETVSPTQASLLFRDRRDQAADIPLTQDFIQEYDRVSKEPRLRTPATLRRAFRFRPQDFEKFFSPEVLSPEITGRGQTPSGQPATG